VKHNEIKKYWNERASEFKTSPEATTNDYYMRQLEIETLKSKIKIYQQDINNIADVGCGNGYSTIELAKQFPKIQFF
jgi:tRNA G46 methylase TrmB